MKRIFSFLALCGAWTGLASTATAQTTAQDTLGRMLPEITVTATRMEEQIIRIPLAVSVITKERLVGIKGYGLDEALSMVPGVLAQSRAGNQDIRITIRGYGARGAGDRSNSGTSRGVRILLDGLPETEPDGRTSFDHIDLSLAGRIDVVRSNASSVYGNAAGGVLNISTIPSYGSSFLSLGSTAGSFGFRKIVAQAGGQLSEGIVYANASNTDFDGWREHSESHRFVANVGLLSALDSKTEIELHAVAASNAFHIPGPLTQAQFDSLPSMSNPTYLQRDERRFNRTGRLGMILRHRLDSTVQFSGSLYVNPKYLQRSERNTFRDFTRYHIGGNAMAHARQYFSGWNNLVQVGMDEAYQDGSIVFHTLSSTNERGDTLRDNKREGANNFGVFIHDEVAIGNDLRVFVGARYDNATYYSENYVDPTLGLQSRDFEHVTPKLGISYLLSPNHSIYANIGGGVEIPAGNETDPAGTYGQDTVYLINPLLDPITSTTYELGTKHMVHIGSDVLSTISYDAAVYMISVKNDIIPYRGGRFYFTAGETSRTGFEFGTSLGFQGGVSLQAAFTYANNRYVDYTIDSAHYGKAGASADYNDNKAAGLPDVFASAALRYDMPFLAPLYVEAGMQHVGEYFVDDANTYSVPSYSLFNASIGLREPLALAGGVAVQAALSVNNLTDEQYAASAFINPDLSGGRPVFLEPGLPRNFTFSISLMYR